MDALLTPIVLALTALFAWLYHRDISAKRATLDFNAQAELGNPAWLAGRRQFGTLTNGWKDALQTSQAGDPDLILYLNHCELVAVAIDKKAMHEELYKQCQRAAYIKTWKLAKPLIEHRRQITSHQSLYENFQRLAEKWEREGS